MFGSRNWAVIRSDDDYFVDILHIWKLKWQNACHFLVILNEFLYHIQVQVKREWLNEALLSLDPLSVRDDLYINTYMYAIGTSSAPHACQSCLGVPTVDTAVQCMAHWLLPGVIRCECMAYIIC